MDSKLSTDPAAWITASIETFTATSPLNTLGLDSGEPAFDRPLVGFSSGGDALYDEYVAHIGDFYLTPLHAIYRTQHGYLYAQNLWDRDLCLRFVPDRRAVYGAYTHRRRRLEATIPKRHLTVQLGVLTFSR